MIQQGSNNGEEDEVSLYLGCCQSPDEGDRGAVTRMPTEYDDALQLGFSTSTGNHPEERGNVPRI